MEKVDRIINASMRCLMAVCMFSLVVGGFWQIFSRWVLGDPSTFTDEFMRYMLIWAGMIGSAYCFYKNQHLALDLVTDRVTGSTKVFLNVFIEIAVLIFVSYVFIYGGGRLAMNSTNASPVLHIPFKVLYAVLPISGIFIVLARVLKYYETYTSKKKGGVA